MPRWHHCRWRWLTISLLLWTKAHTCTHSHTHLHGLRMLVTREDWTGVWSGSAFEVCDKSSPINQKWEGRHETSLEFVILCDCSTVENREWLSVTVSALFYVCVCVCVCLVLSCLMSETWHTAKCWPFSLKGHTVTFHCDIFMILCEFFLAKPAAARHVFILLFRVCVCSFLF